MGPHQTSLAGVWYGSEVTLAHIWGSPLIQGPPWPALLQPGSLQLPQTLRLGARAQGPSCELPRWQSPEPLQAVSVHMSLRTAGGLAPRAQPQAHANSDSQPHCSGALKQPLVKNSGVDSHFLCPQLGSLKSVSVLQG